MGVTPSASTTPLKNSGEASEPTPKELFMEENEARIEEYESRIDYTVPDEPLRQHTSLRESSTCPTSVAYRLDGSRPSTEGLDEEEEEEKERELKVHKCLWGHFTGIILLFGITINNSILAFYFELKAYLADQEWNEVLEGRATFPTVVTGDNYFAGRTFQECHVIVPPSFHGAHMQSHLKRSQGLEMAALVLIMVVLLLALAHPFVLACLHWRKKERLFNVTNFGILGVLIFVAGTFIGMSSLVNMPGAFIEIRMELEDKVGVVELVDFHVHEHLENPDDKIKSCSVSEAAQHQAELNQLLLVMKMCAYRYVGMNPSDDCKNVEIPPIVLINGTNYTVNDLQSLGICPYDSYKHIATALTITSAICCWIIMQIGSYVKIRLKRRKKIIRKTLAGSGDIHNPRLGDRNSHRDTIPRQSSRDFDGSRRIITEHVHEEEVHPPSVEIMEPFSVPFCAWDSIIPGQERLGRDLVRAGSSTSSVHHNRRRGTNNSLIMIAPNLIIHPPSQKPNTKKRKDSIWFRDL